jgi:hypothetical protein
MSRRGPYVSFTKLAIHIARSSVFLRTRSLHALIVGNVEGFFGAINGVANTSKGVN